ncbi:MAG: M15 family metallopeptidase [Xanthomonadales bacterium]
MNRFVLVVLAGFLYGAGLAAKPPVGFIEIRDAAPGIRVELRYFSDDNFVGRPVTGYQAERCFVTREAGAALAAVQRELAAFGLGLKVFDAYRPQRAVDHFVRWAEDLDDTTMKARYYPEVAKKNLFRDGYIAARSGHSRGSTVDLTLVSPNWIWVPGGITSDRNPGRPAGT